METLLKNRKYHGLTPGTGENTSVTVHPLTNKPTEAWEQMKNHQRVQKVEPLPLNHPISPSAVRFVCLSDTHNRPPKTSIPPGDVLIHAGDFTNFGDLSEIEAFNKFLGVLPHKHKVVVAGNHELALDPSFQPSGMHRQAISKLTNCTYLLDAAISLFGIKIYGSPWQPRHMGWAFNMPRGMALLSKWSHIPEDTDVLVTHTPPLGHGDFCVTGVRAGCVELLSTIQQRVHPRFHVFGHIHEGYGITTDGHTMYINASICDHRYRAVNQPIIFDFPLPEGQSKG